MSLFAKSVNDYITEQPARTKNGMKARASTASKLLDFFGQAGSSRGKDLTSSFLGAFSENPTMALRALLWTRDIRGGAGERAQFRNLLTNLEKSEPIVASSIMHKIPEMGRWDDLFSYADPINRNKAFTMISNALLEEKNGLCAKWMPRKGKIAVELTRFMGLSPKQYRKLIVGLTKVVETQMCSKNFESINFSHVPSVASARYQKAFGRNAPEQYSTYIQELKKPVSERAKGVKVNAKAIFPYEIVKSVSSGNAAVADAQWDALPNFVGNASIFPIVDTSGSMGSLAGMGRGGFRNSYTTVAPIDVAVSLGLYLSEKNKSAFKDLLMIFNTTPSLLKVEGTMSQRLRQLPSIIASSTNLHAAFDMLLSVAVRGHVPAQDMPDTLLILSDMQFNCCRNYDDSAMQMIRRKYREQGYTVPKVVFWNLSPYGSESTPVRFDERGTALVSGFSPAIMKSVLSSDLEDFTPYNLMIKALSDPRYDI